ncbi:MAG: hypothetical protein E7Z91_01360 [Cyanobacteria bacterium SIG30]|nr:hypothetical protein [Cyanobacteria bacterium SIG30]
MNYIWVFLILISIITGAINGKLDAVVLAMLESSKKAVEICLGLIGVMAFWLGIMKIAKEAGIIEKFAKLLNPIMKKIFNEVEDNSPAISDIALNFSANAFGLANASTPFGIKAMEELQKENKNDKETATNSMCTLLAMNTAGFQLIPSSVLAILVAQGSKNPTEIILPAFIVTSITFICAIFISKGLERFFK